MRSSTASCSKPSAAAAEIGYLETAMNRLSDLWPYDLGRQSLIAFILGFVAVAAVAAAIESGIASDASDFRALDATSRR